MTKLFKIGPSEDYPYNYSFSATHQWSLPGVICEKCGWVGGAIGSAYPLMNLPQGVNPGPYLSSWPVAPERLNQLIRPLKLEGGGSILQAGTEFGPLIGTGFGKFDAITWINPWTLLLSNTAFGKLKDFGIDSLSAAKTKIALRSRKSFDYCEIQIEATAELHPSCIEVDNLCINCGVRRVRLIDEDWGGRLAVKMNSDMQSKDLMRIRDMEGIILASERFVEFVRALKFLDVTFSQIDIL